MASTFARATLLGVDLGRPHLGVRLMPTDGASRPTSVKDQASARRVRGYVAIHLQLLPVPG
jgi:hypothetical protein